MVFCIVTLLDAGKEPVFKQTITLSYFDEKSMTVKAYEEDMTSNEFMGEGTFDLTTLKLSGNIEIKIVGQDKQQVGVVSCKYSVKSLQPSPMLIVKNIRVQFYRETKFLLKTVILFIQSLEALFLCELWRN